MARGIITIKPSGGSTGATAGRIIVTDGKSSTSSSGSSSSSSTSSSSITPSFDTGSEVPYTKVTVGNVGDLVDFGVDAASGEVIINSITQSGKVIDALLDDSLTVNAGEIYVVKARIEQKITINGGTIALVEGSSVGGKIESATAGSFLYTYKTAVEAKIDFTSAGSIILKESRIDGKVTCNGNTLSWVCKCAIGGSLDILSAGTCRQSGNSVDGKITADGCTACP